MNHWACQSTKEDVIGAGVERAPRVSGGRDGRLHLEDRCITDVANVVRYTGFGHDFRRIEPAAFGPDGVLERDRGIVPSQPACISWPFLSCQLASAVTIA